MDLSSFKKTSATTAWFDFDKEKGMRVELRYVSPDEARKELRECTKTVNGAERYDDELGIRKLAARILAWEGFTLGRVAELLPIEAPEDQAGSAVPCTETNKIALLGGSWQFRPFIENLTVSLAEFHASRREAERKNSGSSPSGPSPAESAATTAAR